MTWSLPDTYHLAGTGRGTATFKFYEGRDILQARLTAATVESPVPGDGHAGFGERPGETGQEQSRHRAPGRLNPGKFSRLSGGREQSRGCWKLMRQDSAAGSMTFKKPIACYFIIRTFQP